MFRGKKRLILWLSLAGVLCGVVCVVILSTPSWSIRMSPGRSVSAWESDVRQAFDAGDFSRVRELCAAALADGSKSSEILLLAGRAAAASDDLPAAIEFWSQLPDDGSRESIVGFALLGEELLHTQFRPSEAENAYRRILTYDPKNLLANFGLADLLKLTGRWWESIPFHLEVVRQGQFSVEHLLTLGIAEATFDDGGLMEECHRRFPDDPLPRIAMARAALYGNDLVAARNLLTPVIAEHPELVEVWARWGRILWEQQDQVGLEAWLDDCPSSAESHPEVWFVRGLIAKQEEATKSAIRCFWEALRRDANHRAANYQLSQLLKDVNLESESTEFGQRADRLQQLTATLTLLNLRRDDWRLMRKAGQQCEQLGRLWEAWAWFRLAVSLTGDRRLLAESQRMAARLTPTSPMVLPEALPHLPEDVAEYAWPRSWRSWSLADTGKSSAQAASSIRWADVAEESGVDFTYFCGATDKTNARRMFAFTGGGVGILDYDNDGWADLYFTQGREWDMSTEHSPPADRLFRNHGDETFADVTLHSGLGDVSFSQGVTVGDYDQDGFPDLYVANIGGNRLYRNQGDGTFRDVTEQAGVAGSEWTTSCVLADVNGDGDPDLYVVNYLAGDDVFDKVCRDEFGEPRLCMPQLFAAAQDRLYLSRGDGTFDDVTESSGIVRDGGKGMGVLTADFDGDGRLDIFVANDSESNFLWVNRSAQQGGAVQFEDRAVATGVAFDRDGEVQACMGIACADTENDGVLDLFVTNFHNESNTLYRGVNDGSFADVTREVGLRQPSFGMLGFGAQFLDADLDGDEDLVIANGHIDDVSSEGIPYRMRPQFFENNTGEFRELSSQSLGPYFASRHLGRSLAIADWNRDGRPDVVVSHLDTRVAVLRNETFSVGHFLSLRLIGVTSPRDPVGAVVELQAGNGKTVRRLTAGDGYQASNQRRLLIGLGASETVESLVVRWPGGAVQAVDVPGVDVELDIIEGR